jgi:tRNA (cytidine/uridine-2'-O-)-methyltransferase
MRIALYQPDIAGNVGTLIRLAACWQVPLEIIMPCGFPTSDAQLRRSAMDYADSAAVTRHADWNAFSANCLGPSHRLVALTTHGAVRLPDATFRPGDVLLMGRESAGLPADIMAQASLTVRIPMAKGARSLNLALATGIALSEALRQTGSYPE